MSTTNPWVADLVAQAASSARPLEGTIRVAGLEASVEVYTDRWDVVHLLAASTADVHFAQGFLHAAERLWQVEVTRRAAQGRLSELFGEVTLPADRFFRTLGLARTARGWVGAADEQTWRVAAPYVAGFAAGARAFPKPIEYHILDAEPEVAETPAEALLDLWSIALLFTFTLTSGWDLELVHACLARALGLAPGTAIPLLDVPVPLALPTSPAFEGEARRLIEALRGAESTRSGGSNAFAISGSRSATGKPLLAADPHLKVGVPCAWMHMHLCAPDLEVTGVTLPGIPGVLIGRNRRIAWGFTNTLADVDDLYLEQLTRDGCYRYGGGSLPVAVVPEAIRVRGEAEPRVHEVRSTHHGPILTAPMPAGERRVAGRPSGPDQEALALRWVHHDVTASLNAVHALNLAGNWEEFRRAAALWTLAGQNMVYADVDGNIGCQFTGPVPIRASGCQGASPLPGWTGEHEWRGLVPFEELPWRLNPPEGYVASANDAALAAGCRWYLGDGWDPPHRVRRIATLLSERDRHGREDLVEIQLDTRSGLADELLDTLLTLAAVDAEREGDTGREGGRFAEVVERLGGWDRRMAADSVEATVFASWLARIAERLLGPRLGPELYETCMLVRSPVGFWGYLALRDLAAGRPVSWLQVLGMSDERSLAGLIRTALEDACSGLVERFGDKLDGWRWGSVHQVWFRHRLAAFMPELDEVMSAGPFAGQGGEDSVNRAAFPPLEGCGDPVMATYRQVIDLAQPDRSLAVITPGNSGNPASPAYRAQGSLWARGRYHETPFSRQAVEAAAIGRLELQAWS